MKVLIADDEPFFRRLLQAALAPEGYELLEVGDGAEALRALHGAAPPPLAILDWVMPGMSGVDVCRKVREGALRTQPYLILVTSQDRPADIVAGLEAGADDYVIKPFDPPELRARVQVGARVVTLQQTLADRVQALEDALGRVKQLQGLLPICAYCKKVRDDKNYWHQVESYVARHSEAEFSHGICPDCYERFARPALERALRRPEDAP